MAKKAMRKKVRPAAKKQARKIRSVKQKQMSKKDLAVFRKLLLKHKEDITDQIRQISSETLRQSQKDAAGDISGYTIHMADVATDSYDREFSLGLASSERELLYEIEDSLKRVDDGSYGACEMCVKSIAKTRLRAIPYTRLCLQCQRGLEKK